MNDEIVSCMAIGAGANWVIAATKDGRVFIGYVRTGAISGVKWTRVEDIPLSEENTTI